MNLWVVIVFTKILLLLVAPFVYYFGLVLPIRKLGERLPPSKWRDFWFKDRYY